MVSGQYTIVSYPPPLNFTHLDLWHFSLTGILDTTNVEYYVTVRVFNGSSALVVKSQSAFFQLLTPSLYVAPTNLGPLQPLTISYTIDAFYANLVNTGGLFPSGNYMIEYALFGRPTDGQFSELANNTLSASVENLMPPMLINPENEDTICEQYPIFTWTPAVQLNPGSTILYNFRMVEISPFQSAFQAMQSNPLYFNEQNIPVTMLNYPAYASPLIFGQQYAWQVDAVVDNQIAASTEISSFVFGCPADTIIDSIPHVEFYLKMKTDDYGGIFKMTNQYLPIAYEEKYFKEANTKLKYRVYDYQSLQPVSTHNYDLIVKEGINYYVINTCPDGMDLEDGIYIFEVTDNSGTRWYTLFEKRDIQCN